MSKIITGFHSIEEKVRANVPGVKLFYSKPGPRIKKILETAKKVGIKVEQVDDATLNKLVCDLPETLQDHRGIVLTLEGTQKSSQNLVDFDEWLATKAGDNDSVASTTSEIAGHSNIAGAGSDKKITVVVLDRVTDPHNVGAILRSCDQFGANLVILPEHNSACDIAGNEVIGRTSAGASAWVPVAVVNNLVRAVEKLKAAGFWVYGADAGGDTCSKIDFAEKSVIIMGSEGTGIAPLLEKQCDSIVSIPTCGKIDSLNVSVATGVLLYELYRRKNLEN